MIQFLLCFVLYLSIPKVYSSEVRINSDDPMDEDEKKILECLRPFIEKAIEEARERQRLQRQREQTYFRNNPHHANRRKKRPETIVVDIEDKELSICLMDPLLKKTLFPNAHPIIDDAVMKATNLTSSEEDNFDKRKPKNANAPKNVQFKNSRRKKRSIGSEEEAIPFLTWSVKNKLPTPFQNEGEIANTNKQWQFEDDQNLWFLLFPEFHKPHICSDIILKIITRADLGNQILRKDIKLTTINFMFKHAIDETPRFLHRSDDLHKNSYAIIP